MGGEGSGKVVETEIELLDEIGEVRWEGLSYEIVSEMQDLERIGGILNAMNVGDSVFGKVDFSKSGVGSVGGVGGAILPGKKSIKARISEHIVLQIENFQVRHLIEEFGHPAHKIVGGQLNGCDAAVGVAV